jgi:hypothetical protein
MVTDTPRSHSPDIELGTYTSLGRVHLTPSSLCQLMFSSQPLPSQPAEDTRSAHNRPLIRVPALIYQVIPTTLLSTLPRSNHPNTPRGSHLLSLPLLSQRRMRPQASQIQTSLRRTMATLPTSYSLSTLPRRINLIRSSQRAGKVTPKGSSSL